MTVAPTTEESTTESPTTEETTTESPATEKSTTESPTMEESTTGTPMTEEPTTQAPQGNINNSLSSVVYCCHFSLVPVQLIFRGVPFPNNSVLSLNNIGDTSTGSAILCTTNRSPCCSTTLNRFGEWYYPDGSVVPNNGAGEEFFRGRGDNQTIYLNRRNNAQSPSGSFCCELPDDSDVTHTLCVSLCKQADTNIFLDFIFYIALPCIMKSIVSIHNFMHCFLFFSYSGCCKHSLWI